MKGEVEKRGLVGWRAGRSALASQLSCVRACVFLCLSSCSFGCKRPCSRVAGRGGEREDKPWGRPFIRRRGGGDEVIELTRISNVHVDYADPSYPLLDGVVMDKT